MNLNDARAKIKRADHHIDKIEVGIMALYEADSSTVKIDPKTGEETLIHDLDDPRGLERIALSLGDAIHNLNCALDYTWLETIQRLAPPLVNCRAKFPVHKKIEELEGAMKSAKVDTLSPSLYSFMRDCVAVDPGWQVAIWPVHTLANRDKHRLLIPVLTTVLISGIEVEDEAGERWHGDGFSQLQKPPYFIRYKRGLHITNKGQLTAEVVIKDFKLGYDLPVSGAISSYSTYISRIVRLFEQFLEMEGF